MENSQAGFDDDDDYHHHHHPPPPDHHCHHNLQVLIVTGGFAAEGGAYLNSTEVLHIYILYSPFSKEKFQNLAFCQQVLDLSASNGVWRKVHVTYLTLDKCKQTYDKYFSNISRLDICRQIF